MRKRGILLISAAVLACSACLGSQGKLEIRSAGGGLKQGAEPVPFRIAEARGHLALGNVALALEGFRKAAREDPASFEAQAGIAACYDRMGRFDLSRRHYEMALAIAPRNQGLLAAFATSLDYQGKAVEAAAVRQEMAALAAPVPAAAKPAPAAPSVAIAATADAQVALNEPTELALIAPAPVGQSVTIALPPPRPATASKPRAEAPQAMAVAPVGRSVTIALPPPRPAGGRQPRLERVSLTEVALITAAGPRWAQVAQPQRTATATSPRAGELRLLNAARVDKLAARTRTFLGRFGWRGIAVGDAAVIRSRSLIVYPKSSEAAASRLSARLGFAMSAREDVRQLTILLGRDAAYHPALRTRT